MKKDQNPKQHESPKPPENLSIKDRFLNYLVRINFLEVKKPGSELFSRSPKGPSFIEILEISLKKLGELRDGFLVAIGAIYFLGYIVWALYSTQYGLGNLPLLDQQYLVAGAIPALLISILSLAILLITNSIEVRFSFLGAVGTIFLAAILFLIITQLLSLKVQQSISLLATSWIFVLLVLLSFALIILLGDVLHSWFAKALALSFVIPITIISLLGYAFLIFPEIPAELGGPIPRCAYLDLTRANISNELVNVLLPNLAETGQVANTNEGVVRTIRLDILFLTNSNVLVRPPSIPPRHVELKQADIHSIEWCD